MTHRDRFVSAALIAAAISGSAAASAQTPAAVPTPTPTPAGPGAQSPIQSPIGAPLSKQPVPVVGNRIGVRYGFVPHAEFFSLESKQPSLVDPQVFVADPASAAGVGPQGIRHAAAVRPASMFDDPQTPIVNAQGEPLHQTLATWFGARGSASINERGSIDRIALAFFGLIPNGRYSVFENHFAPAGVTFTPLDGSGTKNTFAADATGHADLVIEAPSHLTHANAILLVYHSDGQAHGMERGALGINAHHQLIVRIP